MYIFTNLQALPDLKIFEPTEGPVLSVGVAPYLARQFTGPMMCGELVFFIVSLLHAKSVTAGPRECNAFIDGKCFLLRPQTAIWMDAVSQCEKVIVTVF